MKQAAMVKVSKQLADAERVTKTAQLKQYLTTKLSTVVYKTFATKARTRKYLFGEEKLNLLFGSTTVTLARRSNSRAFNHGSWRAKRTPLR